MAISTYKPPIMPPELRISAVGWNTLLEKWEEEALFIIKKDFYRRGVLYSSLYGYMNTRVNEQIRLRNYEEFVYDRIPFPPQKEHDKTEGERRLKEYIDRLRRLVEISGIKIESDDFVLMRNALGFPPSSEADIQSAESRLGFQLPPSYREFLKITNGWLIEQQPSLSPLEQVVPLRELDPEYVRGWQEHAYFHEAAEYVATPEPLAEGEEFATRALDIPTACLDDALAIGVDNSEKAFLLLDPTTVDERGEWRALWLFRYEFAIAGRDFARLMEILYRMNTKRPSN